MINFCLMLSGYLSLSLLSLVQDSVDFSIFSSDFFNVSYIPITIWFVSLSRIVSHFYPQLLFHNIYPMDIFICLAQTKMSILFISFVAIK